MNDLILQMITGGFIGLAAGYLGSFMVLRRMSLVGDALSHVALPGIAVALIFELNPFFGAFAALFVGIFIIWLLEKRTALPSETLVGILFTLSLGIGILITAEHELLEALLGDITKINYLDTAMAVFFAILTIIVILRVKKGVILGIISKDLTKSMGIKIDAINLIFLTLVAIIVALGLKVAGTLLMGSLVIIPAAAARNIARGLTGYTVLAGTIGAASAVAGIYLAQIYGLPPGPLVVMSSGVVFLATLIFKK